MNEDQKFCGNPWSYCEIYRGGGVYTCCPAWNRNIPIGNIFFDNPNQIWNSHSAQQFRQSILDGSFSACDQERCPSLIAENLPTVAQSRNSWLGPILSDAIDNHRITSIYGPSVVKLGYDNSCNLICPSCRTEHIFASKEEQEELNRIRDQFIMPLLQDAKILVMSSDGDPFASKHYREIINLTYAKLPDLKLGLCTNAVLLDEKAWEDCHLERRVVRVQVSIDAARQETYNHVRRGGNFDRLINNLKFLSQKRHSSEGFADFDLLFVVQACNFREMTAFVELGESIGADSVQFMLIDRWDRGMDEDVYKKAKIWDKSHPEYAAFISIMKDDIFRRPIVKLGNVEAVIKAEQPPELHIFQNGGISRLSESSTP